MIPKEKLEALRPDMQAIADIAAATGISYYKVAFCKRLSMATLGLKPK